jgi:acetyltransferase-like isoleucine patch superfamily enzyme
MSSDSWLSYELGEHRNYISMHTIHPLSDLQSSRISGGAGIWQFCVIHENARIRTDCHIRYNIFIENDVVIGDRVTVKNGVQNWDGIRISDDVFIGPNATFTNDPFPRSREKRAEFPATNIGKGASIGANATILPGIAIGSGAMVGAGAVATRNVPDNAIVKGNSAGVAGHVDPLNNTHDPIRPR